MHMMVERPFGFSVTHLGIPGRFIEKAFELYKIASGFQSLFQFYRDYFSAYCLLASGFLKL